VTSIKFPGVTIADNLSLTLHADAVVKKSKQRLFFLRQLRKFGMSVRSLTNFDRCSIESILSGCIIPWYGNCSVQDRKKLQKVVYSPDHHGSQPPSPGVNLCGLLPQEGQ